MRLRRLYLPKFRVLKELNITFSSPQKGETRPYGLTLLVGNNGSGKSTVLQALATLFSQLYKQKSADFPFLIEYSLDGEQTVRIEQKRGESAASMYVGTEQVGWRDRWLPARVICYTTGRQSGWGEVEYDVDEEEEDAAGGGTSFPDSETPYYPQQTVPVPRGRSTRVRLIRLDRLAHVMVAGWLTVLAEVAERQPTDPRVGNHRLAKVFQETGVERITGFSLRLSVPKKLHRQDSDRVKRLCEATTEMQGSREDLLLRFDLREEPEKKAAELIRGLSEGGTGFDVFDLLDRLSEPGDNQEPILREVSIILERKGTEQEPAMLHAFDWLSDGEQSFLGRMAMLCMVGTPRSLILIDEPEVHFNDFWKRQVLHTLDASGSLTNCQVVMATHSSVALTDVHSKYIRVLKRSAAHTTLVTTPPIQTYAADPSEVMVHVFESPFANGESSEVDLRRLLLRLEKEEGPDVVAEAHRRLHSIAPGYWSYKLRQALARREAPGHDPSGLASS